MKLLSRQELATAIYNNAHITGEFLLRSGVISNEYFDKYRFESDPVLLYSIGYFLNELIEGEYDYLAALEMGGIPIATAISLQNGKKTCFVRKEAKEYGTRKFAEGVDVEGKNLYIIEDVVTSGGQIIISTNQLRDIGATISKAVCVIDRESGGKEKLAAEGIELKALFTMSEIKKAVGV